MARKNPSVLLGNEIGKLQQDVAATLNKHDAVYGKTRFSHMPLYGLHVTNLAPSWLTKQTRDAVVREAWRHGFYISDEARGLDMPIDERLRYGFILWATPETIEKFRRHGITWARENPCASRAQQRLFHALAARGEMDPRTVREFDVASRGMKLPERVRRNPATTRRRPLSRNRLLLARRTRFMRELRTAAEIRALHNRCDARTEAWLSGECYYGEPARKGLVRVSRRNPSNDPVDAFLAHAYADSFIRRTLTPEIKKKLSRDIALGQYDRAEALENWKWWAQAAAGTYPTRVSSSLIDQVAREMRIKFEAT